MKYGVIVCSKCKKAKGVNLSYKTTKCVVCGRVLKLKQSKIFYETDSENKLRHAIGLVNANINGRIEEFKKALKKQ